MFLSWCYYKLYPNKPTVFSNLETGLNWSCFDIFSSPEFSQCFRKTVFVWGPCLVFWILLPFHFSFSKSRKDEFHHSLLSLVIVNSLFKLTLV